MNGTNLIKLNISVCGNSQISFSIPIEISENLDYLNKIIFVFKFKKCLILFFINHLTFIIINIPRKN